MKKWLLAALCLALLAGLPGCGSRRAGDNFSDFYEEYKENLPVSVSPPALPSEITPAKDGNTGAAIGFDLVQYPNTAALPLSKIYTVDGWFAQLEYPTGGTAENDEKRLLVLRVAKAESKRLATTYASAHHSSPEDFTAAGVEVHRAQSEKGDTMLTWEKDGFQYLLHSYFTYTPPTDAELEAFITGMAAAPAEKAPVSSG